MPQPIKHIHDAEGGAAKHVCIHIAEEKRQLLAMWLIITHFLSIELDFDTKQIIRVVKYTLSSERARMDRRRRWGIAA